MIDGPKIDVMFFEKIRINLRGHTGKKFHERLCWEDQNKYIYKKIN